MAGLVRGGLSVDTRVEILSGGSLTGSVKSGSFAAADQSPRWPPTTSATSASPPASNAAARVAHELALARGAIPTIRTLVRSELAGSWEAERDFAKAADLRPCWTARVTTRRWPAGAIKRWATYQRLLKDLPGSARADEVRARLAALAGLEVARLLRHGRQPRHLCVLQR